ncbi:RNA-binding transcriptional accessory protein, partial [bacterium]|nr:RNA-binding transcriptional accessory protein [bacterium]
MPVVKDVAERVAAALELDAKKVFAALALLEDGATVPFIARYRKDRTGTLDEVALRKIAQEGEKARALDERRAAILATLEERALLSDELRASIEAAPSRAVLEDLYAPYKQARKTRAKAALEKGLGPLALALLDPHEARSPEDLARPFVNENVPTADEAIEGALDIVREKVATDAFSRELVRNLFWERGRLVVAAARGKSKEAADSKFRDLLGLDREARRVPGHRVLAANRGEREGLLSVSVRGPDEEARRRLSQRHDPRPARPAGRLVLEAIASAHEERLAPAAETFVRARITEAAEDSAIATFERNLRALLLAAPIGGRVVLGLDPGFANGCKLACVDATGKLLSAKTIFPHSRGPKEQEQAARELVSLVKDSRVTLVAIGNGTAARESARFTKGALSQASVAGVDVAIVSEVGASVYSASDLAREELPGLDVTLRGAVSIARRLQDPLAELVKVEPRSLGVGQYQHDVDSKRLE